MSWISYVTIFQYKCHKVPKTFPAHNQTVKSNLVYLKKVLFDKWPITLINNNGAPFFFSNPLEPQLATNSLHTFWFSSDLPRSRVSRSTLVTNFGIFLLICDISGKKKLARNDLLLKIEKFSFHYYTIWHNFCITFRIRSDSLITSIIYKVFRYLILDL